MNSHSRHLYLFSVLALFSILCAGYALSGFSMTQSSNSQRSQVASALSPEVSAHMEHVSSSCQYVSVFTHGTPLSCEGDPSYERAIRLVSPVDIIPNTPFVTIFRFGESPRGEIVSQEAIIHIKNTTEKNDIVFQNSNSVTRTLALGEATVLGDTDALISISLVWRTNDATITQTDSYQASFEKTPQIGFSDNRMTASVSVVAERAVDELVYEGRALGGALIEIPAFFDSFVQKTHNTAAVILGFQ